MAKKIFALVASVVLVVCFAITVSAATANVATTTTYVNGEVAVDVTVTGVDAGTNVTYYATNGDEKVYVNQEKATADGAKFNFTTALANVNSDVKVGYTGVATADEGDILAPKFAISGAGFTATSVDAGTLTVTLEGYVPSGEFMQFANVELVNGSAVIVGSSESEGKITVTFSSLESDVVLKINEAPVAIDDTAIDFDIVEAAAVVVKANAKYEEGFKVDAVKPDLGEFTPDETDPEKIAEANANAVGDRKLTVCGKVVGEAAEYGIIVSTEEIAEGSARNIDQYTEKTYLGQTKAEDGRFAIQIIDTSDDGALVATGTAYYTAVYVYDSATKAYYVVPYATAVTAN